MSEEVPEEGDLRICETPRFRYYIQEYKEPFFRDGELAWRNRETIDWGLPTGRTIIYKKYHKAVAALIQIKLDRYERELEALHYSDVVVHKETGPIK